MVDSLLGWQSAAPLQLEFYDKAKVYPATNSTEDVNAQHFCIWILEQADSSDGLKIILQQILALEPLLVLATTVMNWLQGQRNMSRDELKNELKPRLEGMSCNEEWNQAKQLPHRTFLLNLLTALKRSDAEGIINVLLDQNKQVMSQRGGATWLEWEG